MEAEVQLAMSGFQCSTVEPMVGGCEEGDAVLYCGKYAKSRQCQESQVFGGRTEKIKKEKPRATRLGRRW